MNKAAVILLLIVVSVAPLLPGCPENLLPASACRVVHYYRALGQSELQISAWQRLLFSLMLANSEKTSAAGPKAPQRSAPSS